MICISSKNHNIPITTTTPSLSINLLLFVVKPLYIHRMFVIFSCRQSFFYDTTFLHLQTNSLLPHFTISVAHTVFELGRRVIVPSICLSGHIEGVIYLLHFLMTFRLGFEWKDADYFIGMHRRQIT